MYSDLFCKVYDVFGWNYYPEAFAEQLLQWMDESGFHPKTSMDLACGTGILCRILRQSGIDASGMDFSQGMIQIARQADPESNYDVADMITYCPEKQFDLVTCTGDALNHILNIQDVQTIFHNVFHYLVPGGYFIFDILNEEEISTSEPFELAFSPTVTAWFQMVKPAPDQVNLHIKVYENGAFQFEETIRETVHDLERIRTMLENAGFQVLRCSHQLLEKTENQATTWFILAKKP